MAVTYGFFNSVNGDRKYNAEQMSEYFRGIINEGVYQHLDGGLAVTAGTGLDVNVAAGRAIIQNRWIQNSAAMSLTIAAASETYARKDAVVIRLNWSSRAISIAVKTGTPAASPVAPSMTRNSTTYEMALAYVNVAANATSVTVTDKRSDSTVCGWVTVAQSTSGEVDAMLNDMKTGFDGVEYPSPAAMVQGCDELLDTKTDTLFAKSFGDANVYVLSKNQTYYAVNIPSGTTIRITSADCGFFARSNEVRLFNSSKQKVAGVSISSSLRFKEYITTEQISYIDFFYDTVPIIVTFGKINSLQSQNTEIVPVSSNQIGFAKDGTSWIISIPKSLAAITPDTNEVFKFVNQSAASTITVASGELLYFRLDNKTFYSALAENIDLSHPLTVLLYNSYGTIRGKWIKYYDVAYENKTIGAKSRIIFPVSSLQLNFKRNLDNSFSVEVPNSIGIVNAVENTYVTKNFAGVYTLPYNNYLVYNASTDSIQIIRDVDLTENADITVLLFNSYGRLHGQWAMYANTCDFAYKSGNVKILAHQGSSLTRTDGLGHSLKSQFIAAWNAGFECGECDIKFSSDNVPVCCHDDSFVDTDSQNTITIAEHTFSELETYGYYGEKIASLDEIIRTCKELGMDIQLDQLSPYFTETQWNKIFEIVKKYRMFDHVIFTVNSSTVDIVQAFYENARLMLLATSTTEFETSITLANSLVTNNNEVIVAFTYSIVSTDDLPDYQEDADPRVKFGAWIIDFPNLALQYLPYVDYITSNKTTNKEISILFKA